jgi:elongation factor P
MRRRSFLKLRPQERLEDLQLERRMMEFLFADADLYIFMNPETFEQVEISRAILGRGAQLLKSGMQLPVEFFAGQPISAVFPDIVESRVVNTSPPVHAQHDSAWKEAGLENGMHIRVALFIGLGELVRVDLRSGRYMERVRTERKRSA